MSQTFTLCTVRGEEFTFQSPNAEDIRDLVQFFLEGLKKRSMYVVALQDYKGDGASYLQLNKGDLVVLDRESRGEAILNGGWCSGVNERTGERGDFPSEVVCIVPAMTKPPPDIMVRLFCQKEIPEATLMDRLDSRRSVKDFRLASRHFSRSVMHFLVVRQLRRANSNFSF